ncbi:ABC-type zinc uptake system zinc chaperone [Shewanella sp. TC10]|uniref:ABC-type zinc uptake system zinc chaperone n=1 Tax=Shewanella sp. TC10 TaxID=1419739 RepID=UPI001E40C6AB|nr:ABC-type zinc uptake system zinc chaperone [Shewanella sp. TC10]
MHRFRPIKRSIVVWLSAMLVLLSFAASAHNAIHDHDALSTSCTLCVHQHQFNASLPSSELSVAVVRQHFETVTYNCRTYFSVHQSLYSSRAPPFFS